eukprot:1658313-Rhodomonas_salina.2
MVCTGTRLQWYGEKAALVNAMEQSRICSALAHLRMEGIGALGLGLSGVDPLVRHNLVSDDIFSLSSGRLAGVLRECKVLARLDLRANWLGNELVEKLAEGLQGCKALTHLDLSENLFGNEGAARLAKALAECKALAHLDLSMNRIKADGAG